MRNKFKILILFFSSFFYSNRKSKILFYHDVHNKKAYSSMSTSLKDFQQHIDLIHENKFEIVKKITNSHNQVQIQFDDGFKGLYDCLPFILKNKIFIELFVITSRIGKKNYLSKEELITLHKTGLIKISSHTHTHQNMSFLNDEVIDSEMITSKNILEEILKTSIDSICYPRGYFSKSVISKANTLGYLHQYSSLPGNYFDPFNTVYKRNLVQKTNKKMFTFLLFGAQNIFFKKYLSKHYKG